MKTLLTATALILSMTAAASAADTAASTVLAGGPVYNGNVAYYECWFVNLGSTSITPTAQEVFASYSTTALTSADICYNGTAVPPNETCVIYNAIAVGAGAYSCKLSFSTAAVHIRGALQLLDPSGNLLSTVELR